MAVISHPPLFAEPFGLRTLTDDNSYRIHSIKVSEEMCGRMAGMGLCEGRTIRVIKHGDPTLLEVYGGRIAVAKSVVDAILVEPWESAQASL